MELIDDSGIPPKDSSAIERGKRVASGMVKLLGLNLMQGCAVAGYCMKESGCNPASINTAEASGKAAGYSKALGADCGEGIFQWSFVSTKDKELSAAGLPTGGHPGNISKLSLDQQIMMVAKGSFGRSFLKYKLNTATSWDSAVCCACVQGHGSKYAKDAFDAAGGNINSEAYVRAVMNSYKPFKGTSKPRQDLPRAKAWAKQIYQAMGGKPGDFGMSGGGGTREWKDFNLKDFPIESDEKGKFTAEPVLLGIANHLRVEGTSGSEGDLGMLDGSNEMAFKYKGSWGELTDIGRKVIANANTHTIMWPGSKMYGQKLGSKGQRCCTSGPAGWYSKAGIQLGWGWTRSGGVAVDCNLSRFGFVKLWEGKMGNGNPPSYMPADVVAIYTTQAAHQHGVMYTGTEWLSDYIQRVAMCGASYASMETKSQLWRHPKCWTKPPV